MIGKFQIFLARTSPQISIPSEGIEKRAMGSITVLDLFGCVSLSFLDGFLWAIEFQNCDCLDFRQ